MISWFRPPLRNVGGATVPTLSSAAVTLLGLRVTRQQILRISALLTLRTLMQLIDIPLDEGVQAYLWTFLFSTAQAGVALATAATLFNPGGVVESLAYRLLPRAADTAFLSIFSRLVLIAGALAPSIEAAVLVYEAMRMARECQSAMFRAEAMGNRTMRPLLIGLSGSALCACMAVCTFFWMAGGALAMAVPAVGVALVVALACLCMEGNVMEAALVSVYVVVTWGLALAEEKAVGSPLLNAMWTHMAVYLASDELAAVVLVVSLLLLFVSMARVEWFGRVLAYSHDEAALQTESTDDGADDKSQGVETSLPLGKPVARTLVGALTLMAATFRVLLWAGQLQPGEYLPVPCRGWQVFITVLLYGVYVRS